MYDVRINGVIVVNKPSGLTSHDVVLKIRKVFPGVKVGHGGTLDPQATGVLPIFLGRATALTAQVTNLDKEYEGEMVLGEERDTQDGDGKVISQKGIEGIRDDMIKEAFKKFQGEIEQVPPMYSAVRIKGKRLYKLARSGKVVERSPRKVHIFSLDILKIDLPVVEFKVSCSKGTYIRTLASDIGRELGCGAYLARLSRTRTGDYCIERSVQLDEFLTSCNPEEYIVKV